MNGLQISAVLIPGGYRLVGQIIGPADHRDLAAAAAAFMAHVEEFVVSVTDERTFVASRTATITAEIHLVRPATRQDVLAALPDEAARAAQIARWRAEAASWDDPHWSGQRRREEFA